MTPAGRQRRKGTQPCPLIWVGGKKRLIKDIQAAVAARIPSGTPYRLVEPFTGGATLAFASLEHPSLRPQQLVLGDAVRPLLGFYRYLHEHPALVVSGLTAIREITGGQVTQRKYVEIRDFLNAASHRTDPLGPPTQEGAVSAAAFMLINWAGYNGLWRTNRKGQCNTPWGKWDMTHDWDVMVSQVHRSAEALRACPGGLRTVLWDARKADSFVDAFLGPFPGALVSDAATTLVYVDPPYPGTYSGYAGPWSMDDFRRLSDHIQAWYHWGNRNGSVCHLILSFPEEHRDLLPSAWETLRVVTPDLVGHTVASRGTRQEVLVCSPLPSRTLP